MRNPEKQNENLDEQKFEKEFSEELKKGWDDFDKKSFWEIISWAKFDASLPKEKNFENAFHSKVDKMMEANLSNLSHERKQELKTLQRKANIWKDTKSLLTAYKEIKELFATRHAESKKSESDIQRKNGQKEDEKRKEKSQDFLDELKQSIKDDNKKQEEIKNKNREQQKQNDGKTWKIQLAAELILDWFPESTWQA